MKCSECRKGELEVRRENRRYDEIGLPGVTLRDVEVEHCPVCGADAVNIPRAEELHRALAFVVATQAPRLSGPEIRFLRKHLGWSGADFARTLDVAAATVSRWESGDQDMGAASERFLRLAVLRWKPVEDYPTERLADVAQEGAKRTRIEARRERSHWLAEAV